MERDKKRRVTRSQSATKGMSDAVAAQKRPGPLGSSILRPLQRCSSVMCHRGHTALVAPCTDLKHETPNSQSYSVATPRHIPVLLNEILALLCVKPEGIYIDCTIGEGGHSEAILNVVHPKGFLIGIDCDKSVLEITERRLGKFAGSFKLVHDNFLNITDICSRLNIKAVDGIIFDVGISSYQIDNPERGFSFNKDGPLDMRMDRSSNLTAQSLINNLSYDELVEIFFKYGEERYSKRIASRIITERKKKLIQTTGELVTIIKKAIPLKRYRIHPGTRVFQALRIAVNNELKNLTQAITHGFSLLKKEGRMVIMSFHSLEDRIAKNKFREFKMNEQAKIITKKPLTPTEEEIDRNVRSRSAKLRVVEKTQ